MILTLTKHRGRLRADNMDKRVCSNCRTEFDEGVESCPNCGKRINESKVVMTLIAIAVTAVIALVVSVVMSSINGQI